MSTQHPGGSRRRRIAGERRGRVLGTEQQQEPPAPVPPATPVQLKTESRPDQPPVRDEPAVESVNEPVTGPVTGPAIEPADEPAGVPESRPTGWWGSRASLLLLSGLLAVLLVLCGLLALGALGTDGVADLNDAEAVEQATKTAPAAAEAAAATVLAYDHRSLDADKDAAVKFMTDDFAAEYSETFDKAVAPTAEDAQAKVTASVLASGVIRAGEDTARVLLFVDQATVTADSQRPRIALNRVVMTMVHEDDRWLVDDISPY